MHNDRREDLTGPGEETIDDMPVLPGGIAILVTQAFCPAGHDLVFREDVPFSGHKGISIQVSAGGWSGEVILSPFHGDAQIIGMDENVPKGTKCRLACPICGLELPVQTKCGCPSGGDLHSLHLRKDLRETEQIMLCDVYGCHNSKMMDSLQVVSEFMNREDDA
ncbi:MAG: hypothetical protein ABIK09_12555 [Pseudomonadota bacterium]